MCGAVHIAKIYIYIYVYVYVYIYIYIHIYRMARYIFGPPQTPPLRLNVWQKGWIHVDLFPQGPENTVCHRFSRMLAIAKFSIPLGRRKIKHNKTQQSFTMVFEGFR